MRTDDAGEHVAGAGRCEPGWSVFVDERTAVRGGNDGIGALEDHDGIAAGGRPLRALDFRQLHVGGKIGEKPGKFPVMRCQNEPWIAVGKGGEKRIGIALEGADAIGIQHEAAAAFADLPSGGR